MKMKSTQTDNLDPPSTEKFPKLMYSNGSDGKVDMVIMAIIPVKEMSGPNSIRGIVLQSAHDSYPVGQESTKWREDAFKDYYGEVTIKAMR